MPVSVYPVKTVCNNTAVYASTGAYAKNKKGALMYHMLPNISHPMRKHTQLRYGGVYITRRWLACKVVQTTITCSK